MEVLASGSAQPRDQVELLIEELAGWPSVVCACSRGADAMTRVPHKPDWTALSVDCDDALLYELPITTFVSTTRTTQAQLSTT